MKAIITNFRIAFDVEMIDKDGNSNGANYKEYNVDYSSHLNEILSKFDEDVEVFYFKDKIGNGGVKSPTTNLDETVGFTPHTGKKTAGEVIVENLTQENTPTAVTMGDVFTQEVLEANNIDAATPLSTREEMVSAYSEAVVSALEQNIKTQ
jgi:hypothetical protein